jgi:Domain of unknown function (DUF5671)
MPYLSVLIDLIVLALLVGLVIGVIRLARPRTQFAFEDRDGRRDSAAVVRRIVTYTMAFAGLQAVLYAAAGLLAIGVATATQRSSTLIGAADMRGRVSFYLAALIVGLPIWLGFWRAAQRRTMRAPDERAARERRLFLAAVFASTSVVALFALHTLLRVVLTLPGAADLRPDLQPSPLDGITAGARLLAYGAAWLAYARLGWRERRPRDDDQTHDLAVYVLAGSALSFFAIGVAQAVRQLVGDLAGSAQPALLAAAPHGAVWTIWGSIAAWIIAGGLTWGAIWQYDLARGGLRVLRVLYLYVVLLAAVPLALGSGTNGLYELLRRLFGYQAPEGNASFLRDVLPLLLVGAVLWAYHWLVVRRQAALQNAAAPKAAGGIPWPRRPAVALLTLLGLAMAVPALISLLWLGLDFVFNTDASLSGPDWWRDRVSIGLAGGVVGAIAWLGAWSVLQRAAATAPAEERHALERRLLLGTVTLVSALAALGFTVSLLWLILRTLLGDPLDASTVSRALQDLSTAVLLAGVAAYHGVILRADLRLGGVRPRRVRVVALVAPGAEEALRDLRQCSGLRIDVVGHLAPGQADGHGDVAALQTLLTDLRTREQGQNDSALLILGPEGGSLYPYARAARQAQARGQTVPAAEPAAEGTA